MLESFLNKIGMAPSVIEGASAVETRRRHVRYSGLQAEVSIGDRVVGIQNWSLGGLLFETAFAPKMSVGEEVDVNLTFRFPHETVRIKQTAKVVRAATKGIAAEFSSLAPNIRKQFEKVLDSIHAQSFLESQTTYYQS